MSEYVMKVPAHVFSLDNARRSEGKPACESAFVQCVFLWIESAWEALSLLCHTIKWKVFMRGEVRKMRRCINGNSSITDYDIEKYVTRNMSTTPRVFLAQNAKNTRTSRKLIDELVGIVDCLQNVLEGNNDFFLVSRALKMVCDNLNQCIEDADEINFVSQNIVVAIEDRMKGRDTVLDREIQSLTREIISASGAD